MEDHPKGFFFVQSEVSDIIRPSFMDKPYKSLKTSSNEIELGVEFPQNRFGKYSDFNHIGTLRLNDFTDIWGQNYLAEIELVQVEPESRETFDLQWLQHFTCSPFQNFLPRLTLFSGPPIKLTRPTIREKSLKIQKCCVQSSHYVQEESK